MHIFDIIQTILAFLSLIVSLFVASKVIKIQQDIDVRGDENIVAGRDVNVKRK